MPAPDAGYDDGSWCVCEVCKYHEGKVAGEEICSKEHEIVDPTWDSCDDFEEYWR